MIGNQGVEVGGRKFNRLFAILCHRRAKTIQGQFGDLQRIVAMTCNLHVDGMAGSKSIDRLVVDENDAPTHNQSHGDAAEEDDETTSPKATQTCF